MNLEQIIKFRRAIKKFDSTRKITDKDFSSILEYARWTPSSFGMEPYEILVIKNPELRKKITPAFFGQEVIQQADSLILFINYVGETLELNGDLFTKRDNRLLSVGTPEQAVKSKQKTLENFLNHQMPSRTEWSIRQSYIACGFLTSAAASLGIDTLIIEGYDRTSLRDFLLSKKLIKENQEVGLSMLVGYRLDENSYYPPLRESFEEKIKIVE